MEQQEFSCQIKKDCNIDQHDLIGVEGSANLFERYMKYLFLNFSVDITSSSLELLYWENAIKLWVFVNYFL